jgi:HEPN domain-containing protein
MVSEGRREEAGRWLFQARHDARAAAWNLDGGFHDTSCFLAQQAAEKALKSVHYFLGSGRRILLTHSVVALLRRASETEPGFAECLESGRELDLHYVPARYPNGLPSGYPHQFYGRETAEKAIVAMERILTAIDTFYRHHEVEWSEDV